MTQIHLVTGGTGVVGAALILELLSQTEDKVLCLVRPKKVSAEQRLWETLEYAAEIYGYAPAMLNVVRKRCQALAGDVTLENCGVREKINGKVSQFWHSAASLRYQQRHAAGIFATNTQGTCHAVDLAQTLGVDCFNYISTAYVVGKQSGRILERPVGDINTNNVYEQSKIAAEQVIYSLSEMQTRIFRPSIVIGHSVTNGILNFSGLYGFMRRLVEFRGTMERLQPGWLAREGVRIRMDPTVPLNFIPVDNVVQQAVQISQTTSVAPIFNLTNASPPTVGEVMTSLFQAVGLDAPIFVESTEAFTWADAKLYEQMDFYNSYLIGNQVFDRTNSDMALGKQAPHGYPLSVARLREFYGWYHAKLTATRTQLLVS